MSLQLLGMVPMYQQCLRYSDIRQSNVAAVVKAQGSSAVTYHASHTIATDFFAAPLPTVHVILAPNSPC